MKLSPNLNDSLMTHHFQTNVIVVVHTRMICEDEVKSKISHYPADQMEAAYLLMFGCEPEDNTTWISSMISCVPIRELCRASGREEIEPYQSFSKPINDKLRSGRSWNTLSTTSMFERIEKGPRLRHPVRVFRGETGPRRDLKRGSFFHDAGFGSYSVAPWVAVSFTNMLPCCLFRIKLRPDVPHALMPMNQYGLYELEVVLPPSRFRVDRVSCIRSKRNKHIRTTVYDLTWMGVY